MAAAAHFNGPLLSWQTGQSVVMKNSLSAVPADYSSWQAWDCLFLKILPISYRRGFSSGPCESGEKRVLMCSCLSGSSWNLQLLTNGSKTCFQLVLITILLRAALCSLDIYQLVNGLMLFYSKKSTQPASFTQPLFSVLFLRNICKHSYSEVWVSRPRIYGMQTAADRGRTTSLSIGRRPALLPELLPLPVVILFI